MQSAIFKCSLVPYYPIIFHNSIDTSIKHDYKHWNPIIPIMSMLEIHIINRLPVNSIWQLINILPHRYKFTCNVHTFFRIVPFFVCSPSQHIKCQQYSKYQFKPPNTRTIPTLRVSPLCYSGCFFIILFFGCSFIPSHQVPIVIQVPIQATQHKDDTNPSCISLCYSGCFVIN